MKRVDPLRIGILAERKKQLSSLIVDSFESDWIPNQRIINGLFRYDLAGQLIDFLQTYELFLSGQKLLFYLGDDGTLIWVLPYHVFHNWV